MSASLHLFLMVVALVAPAVAQVNNSALSAEIRTRYGPALSQETYPIPGGEMLVRYDSVGGVCRIELPATAPDPSNPSAKTTAAIDQFLLELIPASQRGKSLMGGGTIIGANRLTYTKYENMFIAEAFAGKMRTAITVTFPNSTCVDHPVR